MSRGSRVNADTQFQGGEITPDTSLILDTAVELSQQTLVFCPLYHGTVCVFNTPEKHGSCFGLVGQN